MRVLIVEASPGLAHVWSSHLSRQGAVVSCAHSGADATTTLNENHFDVVVINTDFEDGKGLAIADFVAFRLPDARVVFVTGSSFFSDGSIFNHAANAHACVSADTSPEDLATVVDFHGRAGRA
ncbi:response regulator [Aliiroseovarius sp. CAU 1755]